MKVKLLIVFRSVSGSHVSLTSESLSFDSMEMAYKAEELLRARFGDDNPILRVETFVIPGCVD